MILTEEQNRAIVTRNKNLLVAAAAGSGKTKVLVERIKQMILEDGYDVDRLLVVTFTNAAAQEMRSRIQAVLTEQLRVENNLDKLKRLEKQIVLMSGASIMTMHAFCQMLLKRNFSKIDLDPKFRVADEQELNLMQQDVIEDLFESKYAEGDENFRRFTDDFGGNERGDEKLHQLILNLYKFSQSNPDPKAWLKSLVDKFDISEKAKLKDTIYYIPAMNHIKYSLTAAYEECRHTLGLAFGNGIYENEIMDDLNNVISKLIDAAESDDWSNIYNTIINCEFQRLTSSRKKYVDEELKEVIKAGRDDYKNIVNGLRKSYFFATEEELLDDMRSLKPSVETLINVTIEFADSYAAAKRERVIIDFNDMEHLALQILSDRTTAMALRNKYQAVMVDEYQDTNGVQETILSIIADGEKRNFFAVGDVKQSIYKFRLADPSIFLDKYNNYPLKNDCMRIDLSKNFRSRREVLDSINFIFDRLLPSELKNEKKNIFEVLYDEESRLYYGANYMAKIGTMLDTPTELYLIEDKNAKDDGEGDDDSLNKESIHSTEREAQIIANRINEIVNDNTQVYDKDNSSYRSVKYSDIVILRRSKKNPKIILDVLKKNNIPAYAMGEETYFQALEIQIIISLLCVLDNARQDIPLAAVLLSPIGGFTTEELATLRVAARYDDLFTVLMTAAASTMEVNPLQLTEVVMQKSLTILNKLNAWRELSRVVSVPELISTIYRETGYYDYVGGLPEGVLRQANLRMLIDRAAAYESTAFRGLSRFLKFIAKIKELNTDLSVARTLSENENVVRIMTIHKSKGLEFPIIFISELGKQFSTKDEKTELLIKHRQLGIGPYKTLKNEPVRYPTLARQVIMQKNIEEQKAEELRILYVAMTRAREKLILVGTKKGKDKKYDKYQRYGSVDKIPDFVAMSANSFLDWIMLALTRETDCIRVTKINALKISIEEGAPSEIEEIKPDMSKLARKSSTLTDKNIPSKMSVTELKERVEYDEEITRNLIDNYDESTKEIVDEIGDLNEEIIYRRPDFEKSKKLTGSEYGILMHSVMQRLDLSGDLTVQGVREQVNKMIEQKVFSIEQAKIIRKNNAAKFFSSSIGQRMINSNEVYRELPFSRLIDASRFFPNIEDKIFIQGIIDVLFREKHEYILIDYKTDRAEGIDEEVISKMREKYKLQIDLYSEAMEAILKRPIRERYLYMLSNGLLVAM